MVLSSFSSRVQPPSGARRSLAGSLSSFHSLFAVLCHFVFKVENHFEGEEDDDCLEDMSLIHENSIRNSHA